MLNSDSTIDLSVTGISGVQYRIRPKVSSGFVEVWDSSSEKWVSGNSPWNLLPILGSELSLKVHVAQKQAEVNIQLLNVSTGQVMELPPISVRENTNKTLVSLVNAHLVPEEPITPVESEAIFFAEAPPVANVASSIDFTQPKYMQPLFVAIFLLSISVGYFIKTTAVMIKLTNVYENSKKLVANLSGRVANIVSFYTEGF